MARKELSGRAKQFVWQVGLELWSPRSDNVSFKFGRTAHSS